MRWWTLYRQERAKLPGVYGLRVARVAADKANERYWQERRDRET